MWCTSMPKGRRSLHGCRRCLGKELLFVFDEFRKEYLNIDKKSRHYDLCVIGSDEVFNCLNSGAWGFTSQLFGNVAEENKVITYAASCGSTKYEELPEKVAEKIRKTFENVSAFSVRDENTHKFVGKLTDKSINDNLDPVLIYNFDYEVEQAALPKMPKHYCVVYSYYNRIHTAEEIDAIKGFCKKYQLTPIAIGAPQFWIKDYIVCSPFQCLKIFKKSDFVITDTFHGTIFVLIPNSFMWWIMNSSDRIMVSSMISVAANGIYAVSYKLPTLVSTLTTIFNQAWSYSAIREEGTEDESEYNNKIFKALIGIVMLTGIGILTFAKPFLSVYVSEEYYTAWKYMPLLTVGCVYLTMASFMATSYTVSTMNV